MAKFYIINSQTPKDLIFELQKIDKNNDYTVLTSTTPLGLLEEVKQLQENSKLHLELKKRQQEFQKEQNLKSFKEYIFNKTFEPNKLSDKELEGLCYEFYEKFIITDENYPKNSEYPKVKIIKDITSKRNTYGFIRKKYRSLVVDIEKQFDNKYGEYWTSKQGLGSLYNINPLGLYIKRLTKGSFNGSHVYNSLGGITSYSACNPITYEIIFEKFKLNDKNQEFWNWFIKTLDVIAIFYNENYNTFYVIRKPDKWIVEEQCTKMYYRYGDKEKFFFREVEVPKWLYTTPKEELNPKDFLILTNADIKAEFVRKIGIDRLVEYGDIVDSFENYPENEMWKKSEYKIIDMHKIIPAKQELDHRGNFIRNLKPFTYAPFLYMKNQTTGVYHLEGISPKCKTLYDALKFRYNGLKIKNFKIENIK